LHLHIRHIPRIKLAGTVCSVLSSASFVNFSGANLDQTAQKIALKALLRLTRRVIVEKYVKDGHKRVKEYL